MNISITFLVMILFSASCAFTVYQIAAYIHDKRSIRKSELTEMRRRIRYLDNDANPCCLRRYGN